MPRGAACGMMGAGAAAAAAIRPPGPLVMDIHYPCADEPATPEYVLAVLRDQHRLFAPLDPEADPTAELAAESTVADWRDADDLVGARELGRALNADWGIAVSDADWVAVLEPIARRPLQGVCELIARHARRPRVRPSRLLGGVCPAAGAFRTVRSLLVQAGAAGPITPATPLAPYTRRYPDVFFGPVARLAPGALPGVRMRHPVYDAGMWIAVIGLGLLAVGGCTGAYVLAAVAMLQILCGWVLTWVAARHIPPSSVTFGDLRTFRDLARVLAPSGPGSAGVAAEVPVR